MADNETPLTLGVDIGGSGMKAAPVDLDAGAFVEERHRISTPESRKPKPMIALVGELARHFDWHGPIGATFPGVVRDGVVGSAANLDTGWIGVDVAAAFSESTGCPVRVINDADAAGLAEMRYGAGRGRSGTVLMLTFGTGIGSGLFRDGVLVPNTELGHVEIDGEKAESRAAASLRKSEDLSWEEWTGRVERYLRHVTWLLSPDLIIVGGGVSRKAGKWLPMIDVDTEIVPAELQNGAGIVGAALIADGMDPTS
ncbi:MAG: polyphosphate--glucose phosphotransferase [Acidimicrobiales bacterium]